MKIKILLRISLLMVLSAISINLFAQTKLPSLFSNHIVLQQNEEVPIWGTDISQGRVSVSGSWGSEATATADENGKWRISLKTPSAGGPYTITVKGKSKIVLSDVMVGEVWLAGGQSNMDMPLKRFTNLPASYGKEIILHADDSQIRFFNVQRNASLEPLFDVKGKWLVSSEEIVGEFSATAYSFARELKNALNVPVGIIVNAHGGSIIEAWMDKKNLSSFEGIEIPDQVPEERPHKEPTLLYNAMFYPLLPYKVKGVIWYQGEANVSDAGQYEMLFPTLIRFWRDQLRNDDLPFYFAEIAPFNYKGNNSAFLREAQLKTIPKADHVGMVSTIDLGDCSDIHPTRKKEVGERFAFWALSNEYGFSDISSSGPIYQGISVVEDGKIELTFTQLSGGLTSFGKELTGFTIAGENEVFYPAKAEITNNSTITVWGDNVEHPVAVRYAFENCPDISLYNKAGLPAPSFRTDRFQNKSIE